MVRRKTWLVLETGYAHEGLRHERRPISSYPFHPEAGPRPIEARDLLREFMLEVYI
jgi:carbamoylphosphate synthase small subunit